MRGNLSKLNKDKAGNAVAAVSWYPKAPYTVKAAKEMKTGPYRNFMLINCKTTKLTIGFCSNDCVVYPIEKWNCSENADTIWHRKSVPCKMIISKNCCVLTSVLWISLTRRLRGNSLFLNQYFQSIFTEMVNDLVFIDICAIILGIAFTLQIYNSWIALGNYNSLVIFWFAKSGQIKFVDFSCGCMSLSKRNREKLQIFPLHLGPVELEKEDAHS